MSNHQKSIINNIPDMVSKRLSNLSSDKRSFLDSKHAYVSALKHSGFAEELQYQEHTAPRNKTRRERTVTWFNPPFSSNVETKIGKKYFPKHHHLHKVINRNTVKLSYCCMPNVCRQLRDKTKRSSNNTKATPPTKIPQLATAETKRIAYCRANVRSNQLFTRPRHVARGARGAAAPLPETMNPRKK